jgi:type II secretory pathway component PulK
MNTPRHHHPATGRTASRQGGSVLIVVLWIVFGLIGVTLYFANSMTYEMRASDNRVANEEAEQTIEGAKRYIICVLSNLNDQGVVPDPLSYLREGAKIGNGQFWLIGRTNVENLNLTTVTYGLYPEASKLNLNVAYGDPTGSNLTLLPRMTQDLANHLIAWRSTNMSSPLGGDESQIYMMQTPPYLCKGTNFETVDELRLVFNFNIDILYGEDANMNGIMDPNENDGDILPPSDNMDGRLDPGLFEYFTTYSYEPNTNGAGMTRINVTTAGFTTQLQNVLTTNLGASRAQQIIAAIGGRNPTGVTLTSPMHLFAVSGMTPAEFMTIETSIRGLTLKGLVNVNTASSQVLQCLPGMTLATAQQLVAARQSVLADPTYQNSIAWVAQSLDAQTALRIGPWITARTYQYMADIAAVGHNGRGYRRVRYVFDTSTGTPTILYRQDLTHLGWALGKPVRTQLLAQK